MAEKGATAAFPVQFFKLLKTLAFTLHFWVEKQGLQNVASGPQTQVNALSIFLDRAIQIKIKSMFLNCAFQLGRENNSCLIFAECHTDVSRTQHAPLEITCTK